MVYPFDPIEIQQVDLESVYDAIATGGESQHEYSLGENSKLMLENLDCQRWLTPDQIVRDAGANQWSYEEFLLELLRTETEQRKKTTKDKSVLRRPRISVLRTFDPSSFQQS